MFACRITSIDFASRVVFHSSAEVYQNLARIYHSGTLKLMLSVVDKKCSRCTGSILQHQSVSHFGFHNLVTSAVLLQFTVAFQFSSASHNVRLCMGFGFYACNLGIVTFKTLITWHTLLSRVSKLSCMSRLCLSLQICREYVSACINTARKAFVCLFVCFFQI